MKKRILSYCLVFIMIFSFVSMNTIVNAQPQGIPQAHVELQTMLRNSDFEMLFGSYTAFTTHYINSIGVATVFGLGLSSDVRRAMLRTTFIGGTNNEMVNAIMNNQNNVNAIARNIINEMVNTPSLASNNNVTSGVSALSSIVGTLIHYTPAGAIRNNLTYLQVFLNTASVTYGGLTALGSAVPEYKANIAMLESLRDLSSAKLWRQTIDNVINHYTRSITDAMLSFSVSALIDKGIETAVGYLLGKPTVAITGSLDFILGTRPRITGLETMMATNDFNLHAIHAFQNAARRIVNGNLTDADIQSYRNAFYFARNLQIVRYEAKRGQFTGNRHRSELQYVDFQLRNLRYMSHDSFIYSRPFAGFYPTTVSTMTPTLYAVTRNNAAVRPRQYENSGQHTTLREGTQITVNGIAHNTHGNRWYRVTGLSGVTGTAWIFSGNVERARPAPPAPVSVATPTTPTTGPQPPIVTPTPATRLTVINTEYGNWRIVVPSNHAMINLYPNATATARSHRLPTNDERQILGATRRVTLSNGTVRYFIRVGSPRISVYLPSSGTIQIVNLNQLATATIRYNANGGTGAPANHSVQLDMHGIARFNLTAATPTKSGYSFVGWVLDNDRVHGINNPGQSIAIHTHNPNTNTTFTYFAQWESLQEVRQPSISITNLTIDFINDVATFTVHVTIYQPATEVLISVRCANLDIVLAGSVLEGVINPGTIIRHYTLLPDMVYRVRAVAVINGERHYTDAHIVDAR